MLFYGKSTMRLWFASCAVVALLCQSPLLAQGSLHHEGHDASKVRISAPPGSGSGAEAEETVAPTCEVHKVAIIGSGIGGSATAYFLRELMGTVRKSCASVGRTRPMTRLHHARMGSCESRGFAIFALLVRVTMARASVKRPDSLCLPCPLLRDLCISAAQSDRKGTLKSPS